MSDRMVVLNKQTSPRLAAAIENLRSVKGEDYALFATIVFAGKQAIGNAITAEAPDPVVEVLLSVFEQSTSFMSYLMGMDEPTLKAFLNDVDTLENLGQLDANDIMGRGK